MPAEVGEHRGEGPRAHEEPAHHRRRLRGQVHRLLDFSPRQGPVEEGEDQTAERAHRRRLGRGREAPENRPEHQHDEHGQGHEGGEELEVDPAPARSVVHVRLRRDRRGDHSPQHHVDDVEAGQHQPREDGRRVEAQRRQLRDGRVHDQHDRRRDQNPQGPARADDPGGEVLAVVGRGHGREGEQPHQRHHRAHDAACGGEHRARDESRDRHGAGQVPGRELERIEEAVDDVRALHHVAHEQEERHRHQGVVFHHRVGVLVEQVEDLVVERVGDGLDGARLVVGVVAEAHPHGDQRECDREPEQHQDDEHRQHQDCDFGIRHRRSLSGRRPAQTAKIWINRGKPPPYPRRALPRSRVRPPGDRARRRCALRASNAGPRRCLAG